MTTHKYGNLSSHMKTTIELPDDLFVAAKKRAADERRPLRAIVEEALRAKLAQRQPARTRTRPIRWMTAPGGLPAGMNVSSRVAMHDWLRARR